MSKRSYRRLAVVAGAALALGSMAPAMAQRVDVAGVADVDVSVNPAATSGAAITDVTTVLAPAYSLLNLGLGAVTTQEVILGGLVTGLVKDTTTKVVALGLGLADDCGLVNVLSCNNGSPLHIHNNEIDVLSPILGDDGPGNSGIGGLLLDPHFGLLASVGLGL